VRVMVATHPAPSTRPPIGVQRGGLVSERFVTILPQQACVPKDVLDRSLHRGSFETVRADEDVEHDPDRWCSSAPNGQEFWHILGPWVWNLRLELGQHRSPTPMRTTECAPTSEPAPPLASGPPQWPRPSFPGGFPGSAFLPQPDGTLLCPAHYLLSPHER
jgi:hypothetical protein